MLGGSINIIFIVTQCELNIYKLAFTLHEVNGAKGKMTNEKWVVYSENNALLLRVLLACGTLANLSTFQFINSKLFINPSLSKLAGTHTFFSDLLGGV